MRRFCACLLMVMARAAPASDPLPPDDILNLANMISSEELPSWFPSTRCSAGVIHTTPPSTTPADAVGGVEDDQGAEFVPLVPSDENVVPPDRDDSENEIKNSGSPVKKSEEFFEGDIEIDDSEAPAEGASAADDAIEGEIEYDDSGPPVIGKNGDGDENEENIEGEIEFDDSGFPGNNGKGDGDENEEYVEGEIEYDDSGAPAIGEKGVGDENEENIEGEIEYDDSGFAGDTGKGNGDENEEYIEGEIEYDDSGAPAIGEKGDGKVDEEYIEGKVEYDDSGPLDNNGKGIGTDDEDNIEGEIEYDDSGPPADGDNKSEKGAGVDSTPDNGIYTEDRPTKTKTRAPGNYRSPSPPSQPAIFIDDE